MAEHYPLTAQTTYADLLDRLRDARITNLEIQGSPYKKTVEGNVYWYASRWVGDTAKHVYLGPDSDALRSRVERALAAKEDKKAAQKERGNMVQALRKLGYPSIDAQTGKVLYTLAKAGVFRLGAVLVGAHAFRLFPSILSSPIPAALNAATEDVDLAQALSLSIAVGEKIDPDFEQVLNSIERFQARPGLRTATSTAWRGKSTLVELLVPEIGKPAKSSPLLPALQAHAQPLRFLDYLIEEPVEVAGLYRYGVLLNVPQPSRYAIHKLIVANRRRQDERGKAMKDIMQATVLIEVLAEDDPASLDAAWAEAWRRGPSWQKSLLAGGKRLTGDAAVWFARTER